MVKWQNTVFINLINGSLSRKFKVTVFPWLQQLVFLADIFNKLNEFRLSVQGRSITVLTADDKLAAVKLLASWYHLVQQHKIGCFYTVNEYLKEEGKTVSRCKTRYN